MIAPAFVDTNIFVYARDTREPRKQRQAASLLQELWRDQLGRTSMQVLSEYYVCVTRKLEPGLPAEEAWDDIQLLLRWSPQVIDRSVLTAAREIERRYRLSWEDSTIVAAAQLQDCAILLSEDLQNGLVIGGVTVRNPFASAVAEARLPYVVVPQATSRHRSRGRPRRQAA